MERKKKESACNAGDLGSVPGLGRSTPVFLPGKSHGQRSLAGYSSWGCKESDMTEQLTLLLSFNSSASLKVLALFALIWVTCLF